MKTATGLYMGGGLRFVRMHTVFPRILNEDGNFQCFRSLAFPKHEDYARLKELEPELLSVFSNWEVWDPEFGRLFYKLGEWEARQDFGPIRVESYGESFPSPLHICRSCNKLSMNYIGFDIRFGRRLKPEEGSDSLSYSFQRPRCGKCHGRKQRLKGMLTLCEPTDLEGSLEII